VIVEIAFSVAEDVGNGISVSRGDYSHVTLLSEDARRYHLESQEPLSHAGLPDFHRLRRLNIAQINEQASHGQPIRRATEF